MLNLEDKTHASGTKTTKVKVRIDVFYDNFVDLTDTSRQHRPKHETSVTQLETCLNNKPPV